MMKTSAPSAALPALVNERPSHNGVELREHPRTAIAIDVTMESESQFFAGLSLDVSGGGIFVETYRALAIGSRVELELSLPDGLLAVSGTVRWSRPASGEMPPGVGVRFDSLDVAALRRIESFCNARAPLYVDSDE